MSFPHDPADAAVPFSDEEEAAAEAALDVDLTSLVKENEDQLGQLQRLQADFENYRKQAQKRSRPTRSTGRRASSSRSCFRCSTRARLAFAHGVDGIEPIWSALLGALRRMASSHSTASASRSTPSSTRR